MSATSNIMRASWCGSSRAIEAARQAAPVRRISEYGNVDHCDDKGAEGDLAHPTEASTVKVADTITPQYRVPIDKSPFAALATCGPEGLDCSQRGDLPGFVRAPDVKTLMM